MIGGYATVAAELNTRFAPQPPIDRRQVYQWDHRQTRNHAGELPPQPVEKRPGAKRSQPTRVFETGPWVTWFAKGVRGPRRRGWRVWVQIDQLVNDPAPYEYQEDEYEYQE
jgi:hypothetical protein